jgi:glycosyltransferase involved in cell wall biosynthesis
MQNQTHILYISYDGMTDNLGQSQVLPYIEGLSKLGYVFTLISCEKEEKYQSNKEVIEAICKRSNINWQPLKYTKKPPILSTIKDVLSIQKRAEELHRLHSFQIVHCRSYLSAIVGLKLKKKFGVKFLFDMRGFWADERVDGGQWNLKNPIYKIVYRYFKNKETQFLNAADYVISLTQKAKDEIFSWKHIKNNPVPIEVIPCCTDMDFFNPIGVNQDDAKRIKTNLGIQETDFVLTYIGGASLWYMIEEMLDFFKILLQTKPNARFLYITGDNTDKLRALILEKNIASDKVIITSAKRSEVPLLLSLSDATIFFIKPTYSKMSSSPTKQGEIMAMGIPVFCNSGVGDTDNIVKKYHSGIVIDTFQNEAYQNAINHFFNNNFAPVVIRNGANEFFSLINGVQKFAAVYKKMLN